MNCTYAELAGMIDHAPLHPTLTDAAMREGCDLARRYAVASVCVKPCAVPLVAEALRGSAVGVGTVIGFPHGGTAEAHGHGALLKVIFETDFLPEDATKIQLCEISDRVGADFVKTSTGFGFVRQADGHFRTWGATEHDLALMRAHTSPRVGVKASGGVRSLDGLLAVRGLGAARCGTSATAQILDEYHERLAAARVGPAFPSVSAAPAPGNY